MKIAGIVSEYNPFHNGHKYQVEKTREMGATHIVSVMSGNFVQRGDVSIYDKHIRAKACVENGVDLVLELPCPYSVSSAEIFAKSAVYLLNSLGVVDILSFGSESGDINELLEAVNSEKSQDLAKFKELLSKGEPYPKAFCESLKDEKVRAIYREPNNLLGIEYIKALKAMDSKIEPVTVKRIGAKHDDDISGIDGILSASEIRKRILDSKDVSRFLSTEFNDERTADLNNLSELLFYKLITMKREELMEIPDMSDAICDRIKKALNKSKDINELLFNTKTKCYSMARIRRIIVCILLGVKRGDLENFPPYARILAFNERGSEILRKAKKTSTVPIHTSLLKLSKSSDFAKRISELDEISSKLQSFSASKDFGLRYSEFSKKIEEV